MFLALLANSSLLGLPWRNQSPNPKPNFPNPALGPKPPPAGKEAYVILVMMMVVMLAVVVVIVMVVIVMVTRTLMRTRATRTKGVRNRQMRKS